MRQADIASKACAHGLACLIRKARNRHRIEIAGLAELSCMARPANRTTASNSAAADLATTATAPKLARETRRNFTAEMRCLEATQQIFLSQQRKGANGS
jgi:hypothetical protein